MKLRTDKILWGMPLLGLFIFLSALGSDAAYAGGSIATYEVTITNLTSGQPLTPPVIAAHRASTGIFSVGKIASSGIQQVAENGNSSPLLTALGIDKHVFDIAEGTHPLVPSGTPGASTFPDSVTLTITSGMGAKYLSFASMLICTNDGFTGLDTLRLPKRVGDSVMVTTDGYDAGTEINTEDFADMVPPCQPLIGISSADAGTDMSDSTLAELGVISHHGGIQGGDDLIPGTHGWSNPVARVSILRVS